MDITVLLVLLVIQVIRVIQDQLEIPVLQVTPA